MAESDGSEAVDFSSEEGEEAKVVQCEQPAAPGDYCAPGYQHLWYFHKVSATPPSEPKS